MNTPAVQAQDVKKVKDKGHRKWSKVIMIAEQTSMVINSTLSPVIKTIRDVQEFTAAASTIVSGVVKNLKMVRRLIKIEKEIREQVEKSIALLAAPRDEDGDGEDDLGFLDKWKHVEILLAIAGEADGVFELFKNVIEQDGTVMDDKGRLTLIKDAYRDALRVKMGIRLQVRRINRQIYKHRREKRELGLFTELFKTGE